MRVRRITWWLLIFVLALAAAASPLPAAPDYRQLDEAMQEALLHWHVPGGSLAVGRAGHMLYQRGYGWADVTARETVTPNSRFRIASLSKLFTATAVMRLEEQHKIDLDAPFLQVLPEYRAAAMDPRLGRVTVRQLLQHTGGWDRKHSFDPIRRNGVAARALGVTPPAAPTDMIRYMLAFPLDFEPGTRYAYSNFGYLLLGRIIEKVSGQHYEDYVRSELLEPMGVRDMTMGGTLLSERQEDEVRYYDYPGAPEVRSVFTDELVPGPYGEVYVQGWDAAAGWIASPSDVVRFGMDVYLRNEPVLQPVTLETMLARPAPPPWQMTPFYYACGIRVEPRRDGGIELTHTGGLRGCSSMFDALPDGTVWVAEFNSRPPSTRFYSDFSRAINRVLRTESAQPSPTVTPFVPEQ
jgi:N-acyl-D-amino-acid deacylase